MRGSSTAICRISLRFFSPPEKPTFTGRFSISASMSSAFAFSRISFRNVGRVELGLAARLALGVERGAQEGHVADARDLDRILEREEQPRRRPLLRLEREQVLAVERRGALGDLVALAAGEHVGERRLARAVRPHDRMHLARPHLEVDALEDRLVLLLEA